MANGNQNGGGPADPTNMGTLDELYNQDVTSPGYVRTPVCSPEIAWKAWNVLRSPDKPGQLPMCRDDRHRHQRLRRLDVHRPDERRQPPGCRLPDAGA